MNASQFAIYKGSGALQLRLLPPNRGEKFPSPGCVMMDICPSGNQKNQHGNPVYNWDGKITLKLSDRDVADVLLGLQGRSVKIVHDPGARQGEGGSKKFLEILPGQRAGTVIFRCSYGDRSALVPLDANDALRMRILLTASIPVVYGWTS